jgi:hypothetical protein
MLAGCQFIRPDVDQPVAVKYKYVVTEIPQTMLVIPEQTRNIDVNTATDKDAAKWIIESENRARIIEKQLKAIRDYQTDKLKSLTFPPEDIIKN